ncbi:hypothetical protein IWW50_003581 [Coemansia erecta]|nr:hypothetical protein IWW50_003581 [Coemansia erecta]
MSCRSSNNSTSFSVFADSTPKPTKAKLRLDKKTSNCAVLQELNTNKPFTLSPNSQIRAEKENFDPVKKQLVAYRRSKSYAQPLGVRVGGQQGCQSGMRNAVGSGVSLSGTNKARDGLRQSNHPKQRMPSQCQAKNDVDDLVHLLSDVDIGDHTNTPCRKSNQQPCQKQPPPILRLDKRANPKPGNADRKTTDTGVPKANMSRRFQERPSSTKGANISEKRIRGPKQQIGALQSPPGLKCTLR